ncbi:sugar phosphate nucleotidyltransferase (plasmid) [Sulfitobacter faviae]|uniref:glucose-1-phosphate thymidylyltransferase n=1 Tax=Sulfitobacter faviae TaxID=1775881 RepID=A0AAX3LTH6_9RHOB|nr:sugar phosphate nucleotidyltransferase [Sulfitobacter faviae]WCE72081.1 sugar phosphate nucleotidyltransferase [Sulfitobacter faviae]
MKSLKKVTVIGGSGFVGTNLCQKLADRQIPFEIIDIKESRRFPEKCKMGDVRDIMSLRNTVTGDIVVNLAAVHRDDVSDKSEYFRTNVEGAENLAKVCTEKCIRKIVFTSSVAVYGFAEPGTDEAGIREIAVITTPQDQEQFQRTLGDGSQWGISLSYITQPSPDGLAQAFILAEEFLEGAPSALVLGDNIFYGHGLPEMLAKADAKPNGGTVFGYQVSDPERYGVVDFDAEGQAKSIIEKPEVPPSNFAVTGLYFLDGSAPDRARQVAPSARGELEITSLLEMYLQEGALSVERMGRGFAWLDTGTHESLLDAGTFVRTLEKRQGQQAGCLEEIAYLQCRAP